MGRAASAVRALARKRNLNLALGSIYRRLEIRNLLILRDLRGVLIALP